MHRCISKLAWLVVLAAPLSAQDNTPPKGFTALFNGKNLDGWRGGIRIDKRMTMSPEELRKAQLEADSKMLQHWKVEKGVLVNDGKGVNLASVEYFKNFELMVDWKINEKGDSGIYLRGLPQVQVWDSLNVNPMR